ncbi:MAG: hypothetical protein A2V88_10930 [Elusimicrobia bacterium RBG_16_66_12]|nr:MAG: hypothetical protein A2V88_10930 [Elusimicrobia bacterium RBG_16_66_12]
MNGLWADGWFYISSAGLLVSGVLFFFLLGQYRVAADAADGRQVALEPEAEISPGRPVYIPEESAPALAPAPAPKVASVPSEPPAETPKAEAAAAAPNYAGLDRRRENTTGGISPAVVYLQNIKSQLEGLHAQVAELTKRVESVTSRDEALIERLGELAHAVEGLKSPAVAAAPAAEKAAEFVVAPAAAPAPAVVAHADPVVMKLELGPAPGAQAVKSDIPAPDATIRLEPGDIFKAPEPAPEKAEAAEAEKPARRGPVWPV